MTLPAPLKTPGEMYAFCCKHGYGSGFGRHWGQKNFTWIAKHLQQNEQVFFTFVGLHRFHSMSAHQRNFVYAITNHRILMGQVRIFGLTRFESITLDQLQNISINYENSIGVMSLILNKEVISIGMAPETAQKLGQGLMELLPVIQELAHQMAGDEAGADGELPEKV